VDDERLDRQITMRIASSDQDRLDRLADHVPFKPSQIARACLRLGLSELLEDPTRLLQADARELTETNFKGWKTKDPG